MVLPRRAGPLIAVALLAAACAPLRSGVSEVALEEPTPEPAASETFTLPEPLEETTPAAPRIRAQRAAVTKIVDGDTIDVALYDGGTERLRFIGVDTPERGQPFYARAKEYTASKAPIGSTVFLELDVEHRDRYGRLLTYVWLAQPRTGTNREATDLMLNARLVRRGLARTLTIQPNSNYADLFAALQRRARADDLNLWAPEPVATKAAPRKTSGPRCHPSYTGKCLKPDSPDYDCEGGSGDGPDYTDGPVYVEGDDPYELDRDGDGVACES